MGSAQFSFDALHRGSTQSAEDRSKVRLTSITFQAFVDISSDLTLCSVVRLACITQVPLDQPRTLNMVTRRNEAWESRVPRY